MTGDEHDMSYKVSKIKPPIFHGIESKDVYEFIIDFHEWLHKMGVVDRYGVELVMFRFQGDSKMCRELMWSVGI